MKLLGATNQKQVVASISHYDCVSAGEGADYINLIQITALAIQESQAKQYGLKLRKHSPNYLRITNSIKFANTESGISKTLEFCRKKNIQMLTLSKKRAKHSAGELADL